MKAMDMKKRIDLELRGKDPHTIKELNLDSCRGQQLDGLSDEFENLEILSLINVGLTTLKGFPKLPKLRKLELSDNRMYNGLDNLIACKSITHLNLSGNKIKDAEELAPLAHLTSLRNLDLFNCEVTKIDGYREKIFKLLPSLKFLDGFDQNEQEDEEDDEEYAGDSDDEDEEGEGGDDDDDDDGEDDDDEDDDEEEEIEEDSVTKKTPHTGGKYGNGQANGVGNLDEEEDDDDEEDEDDGEEFGNANQPGLSYLEKDDLEDEEDDQDFDQNGEDEEDDDDDDDDEEDDLNVGSETNEDSNSRGARKRKHEDTDDADSKTQ